MPNLSAQAQKFGTSMKKRLHWASVVRARMLVSHRKARELHTSDTKNMTHNVLYIAAKSLEDIYFHIYLVEVDISTPFNVPSNYLYNIFYIVNLYLPRKTNEHQFQIWNLVVSSSESVTNLETTNLWFFFLKLSFLFIFFHSTLWM